MEASGQENELLSVTGLTVRAGGVPLVEDITFGMARGERVAVIGESGSGKSLTAFAVMQLLPDALTCTGQIRFDGRDLVSMDERDRCRVRGNRIAMVFQEPMTALNPLMRVGRQVAEALTIHQPIPAKDARARSVELLERVQLAFPRRVARAYPHQLSGGQRQRVMLAIAVACRPALLLADEPTTALDVTVQARVLGLLDELVDEAGTGLLLISHDIAVVSGLCQRLLVMYAGRIVESGTVDEVLSSPRHPYTVGLLQTSAAVPEAGPSGARRTALPTIPGTVHASGRFPEGCPFRDRCPRASEQCLQDPSLTAGPEQPAHYAACWHPVEPGDSHGDAGSDRQVPELYGAADGDQ